MARLESVRLSLQIAGCPNVCRHCKDGGHPPFGALMSVEDASWVLDQFRSVADMFLACVYFEETVHPDMLALRTLCRSVSNDDEVDWTVLSTNGYGIANAEDPDSLLHALAEDGFRLLSLTLHGERDHHDWFVCRAGAFDDIWKTAGLCAKHGLRVHLNFYLDRHNVADFDRFLDRAAALGEASGAPPETCLCLPHFVPTPRLRAFERTLRPRLTDLEPVRHHVLERWHAHLEHLTERHWIGRILDPVDPIVLEEQPRGGGTGAAFIVDGAFDVYEKPWPWSWSVARHGRVRHGNLRADGLNAIIERHLAWRPLRYPAPAELARGYGDAESDLLHRFPMHLYMKWIDRWMTEHGAGTA